MSEAELIEGCLQGSLRHQRELYNRFSGRMMGLCMRYAASEPEAEDILQEGFVTVFRKMDSYKGTGQLGGWIRKVILNTALMHYRKNKKHAFSVDINEVGYMLESSEDSFQQLSAKDLMFMIQELPSGCRVIFNLYAVEGFNHREIAERLGISVGTSKSQYSRARGLLQGMIETENRKASGTRVWK